MDTNRKTQIRQFIEHWTGKGYERGESQTFWIELLHDVLGIARPTEFISFESQVKLSHTSFIDAYIPSTKVLIEQKSIDKDLRASIKQSDGTMLTPFQQAKRYASELPVSKHPRWVVVCNFQSFLIYDMEQPQGEPFEILLKNLEKDFHQLLFLVGEGQAALRHEMEVSIKAGELVGRIYDAFLKQYGDNPSTDDLHALNVLCVRLVFCLYAEDSGVFGKDQFYQYLSAFQPEQMRMALRDLFAVLDTPVAERDRFLEPRLAAFPYVNGSLFRQKNGESIPPLTQENASLLLDKSSRDFDWSEISPTIFGAVFESTLNPETRRSGGMHYTSIENIHKVIDPLFLDDLNEEFAQIAAMPTGKQQRLRIERFQQKLASLKFLDPACGSGNFLTETYISLRKLENRAISLINKGQVLMGIEEVNPIKVSIQQFYGIEINDFAVTVATTALWIAESQMMAETQNIIQFEDDFLPLKSYTNIREGNALRIDWAEVIAPKELNYIIGNPPFVGNNNMNANQREDILPYFPNNKTMDYVGSWYVKAADYMQGTSIKAALVSTNSICQGELVPLLWKPLFETKKLHIDFAWKTFRWDSESSSKAHVHCVIVGFSVCQNNSKKKLYYNEQKREDCDAINGYLINSPSVFVESHTHPLSNVPAIRKGNQPTDGGNLIFENKEQMLSFVSKEPNAEKFIKRLTGAKEFLNNIDRYCLWLKDATPCELKSMPTVCERMKKVQEMRLQSSDKGTVKLAETPHLFRETNNPPSAILVPSHSSENRRYIPLGFIDDSVITTNATLIIPDATLYHFGILESSTHMAWMRTVCGRLKSDYRYSKDIVYNNFPWPTPTDAQKAKIEQTAQAILDARELFPDSSLADLYDEVSMPAELRKAHQQNDRAVMEAYGFAKDMSESDIVAALLKMYQELTK